MEAIEVDRVIKRFGDVIALDGLSFGVEAGTICGLLGPNGAGKTTLIQILCTLLPPDGGRVAISGVDVVKGAHAVRGKVALTGQNLALDSELSGRDNLVFFGRLAKMSKRAAVSRAEELLVRFGLAEAANRPVLTYSGGMQRKLDLAASLIAEKPVLLLDEPTTGLDPTSRRALWDLVHQLRDEGTTVLLTTQYLEEADELSDKVVMMKAGSVIAEGTPARLKRLLRSDVIEVRLRSEEATRLAASEACRRLALGPGELTVDEPGCRLEVEVDGQVQSLGRLAEALDAAQVPVEEITFKRPTLDDVFIHYMKEEHGGAPLPAQRTDVLGEVG